MFKPVSADKYYRLINFGPCVLITSYYNRKTNAAPVAWTMPVNDEPPLVAIAVADTHYTRELIDKSGEFVINVVGVDMLPAINLCGKVSGRKVNKIEKAHLHTENGVTGTVPHLARAVGFIECRVHDALQYEGVTLYVAQVLYTGVQPRFFKGGFIAQSAKVVQHLGGGMFITQGKRYTL